MSRNNRKLWAETQTNIQKNGKKEIHKRTEKGKKEERERAREKDLWFNSYS